MTLVPKDLIKSLVSATATTVGYHGCPVPGVDATRTGMARTAHADGVQLPIGLISH